MAQKIEFTNSLQNWGSLKSSQWPRPCVTTTRPPLQVLVQVSGSVFVLPSLVLIEPVHQQRGVFIDGAR